MSISNSFLDYEIPSNFQYSIRQETLTRKIYKVGKKLLTFLQRNQFAIAISFSSFLITKTIASQVEDNSIISTAETTLKDCQDRICAYWKETLQSEKGEGIEKGNNSLSKIDFRCNTSHPDYKPFRSLNRCLRDWCKYANGTAENAKECLNRTEPIVHLWNKFCPKSRFDRLKNSRKPKFLEKCLKKLCHHYKSHNQKSNFYSLCIPLELHNSMEKLYKLVKNWKKEDLETKTETQSAETVLSMTSSSLGIISGVSTIVASVIGCYVAKVTMASVSSALPSVSVGLRNIVDGTLAYARRASALPTDLLSVPSMMNARVSELSSHVESLYYDAASVASMEQVGEARQVNFNFGYEAEEEEVLAGNLVPEIVQEKKLLHDEILPGGANFGPDLAGKVVESLRTVTQKATTPLTSKVVESFTPLTSKVVESLRTVTQKATTPLTSKVVESFTPLTSKVVESFTPLTSKVVESLRTVTQKATTSLTPSYEEVVDTTETPMGEFFEFKKREEEVIFPNHTNFLHNITTKSIELLQVITQKFICEETEAITSQKTFTHTPSVIPLTPRSYNSTGMSSVDFWRRWAKTMNTG